MDANLAFAAPLLLSLALASAAHAAPAGVPIVIELFTSEG